MKKKLVFGTKRNQSNHKRKKKMALAKKWNYSIDYYLKLLINLNKVMYLHKNNNAQKSVSNEINIDVTGSDVKRDSSKEHIRKRDHALRHANPPWSSAAAAAAAADATGAINSAGNNIINNS